jgi:aldehyde:ferredoxin oxidoreductase
MNKIIRINMSDPGSTIEAVPADRAGLGGRGPTSIIVAAEVPPACHSEEIDEFWNF